MTTREMGAIVHSLCIVVAVMACSSWPLPDGKLSAMPGSVSAACATPPELIQSRFFLA
jgi:hypothetical protein